MVDTVIRGAVVLEDYECSCRSVVVPVIERLVVRVVIRVRYIVASSASSASKARWRSLENSVKVISRAHHHLKFEWVSRFLW